jgi:8-oxo-dGTP pyrophosphatase MutT (NUDIX family)
MDNKEKKTLYTTPYFDVVLKDGMFGVEPSDLCVVVMPFVKDQRGLPKALGVLKEYNPMRDGDYSITLVTGRAEGEDPDLLSTAIRELKEETGYDVKDIDRWFYLGMLTTSKIVMQDHPCFAVDITGLTPAEKEGDGTESEEKSKFLLTSVKEALNTNDAFVPALFMKIFRYIFKFDLNSDEGTDEKINNIKKRLDIKFLTMDGVNGSIVRHSLMGDPYIEYTVTEITDSTKTIPGEVDGVSVVIKLAEPHELEEDPNKETNNK